MRIPLLSALLLAGPLAAQKPTPGPPQSRSILIQHATVHVGDGRVIDDGAVGFRNGTLDHVGFSYGVTATYDTVIDARGAHLYPGLILPDATLGLAEIDQVNATVDLRETGDLTPEARALSAYNTDSRIIPTVRRNGVLIAQIAPRGGIVSGRSSVVRLDAWDWEEAAVRADEGVHLYWPQAFGRRGWWAEPAESEKEKKDERSRRIELLEDLFIRARAYAAIPDPPLNDQRLHALRDLFAGKATLYLHAEVAQDIQEGVRFAQRMGIKRTVLVGGYDAWRVADLLKDRGVPVILRRLHSLPLRPDDPVDLPYRLPALLKERGVPFCLGYAGDMERMGSRNLAFVAGTASAHGLTREEALRAVTLDAARILGIDAHYGSLEKGKSATLFLSAGDALDMRGNRLLAAFIDGRAIVLDHAQEALYQQHLQRLEQGR